MTYCLGILVDEGLVLASDSRTNAGVDQVSTYSKMHRLIAERSRSLTLVSAGNLATTQAVVRKIGQELERDSATNLMMVSGLSEAAEYVGQLNAAEIGKHRKTKVEGFSPEASFILGGSIDGAAQQMYLIYPEGNYIRAAARAPYLQIGELKYGKPILDRIISPDLPLAEAVKCALVSIDSTMRSNAAVGPPIELLISPAKGQARHLVFNEEDDYLRELRAAWQASLKRAFESLPDLTGLTPNIRLVDSADD